ncbi:ribosome biogenesis protein [Microdochium trichocladiopsis]|uniref:Ribosome biogenesis protein n=1 Tax=Microdochium trichocladiopsis TaxID=1682393 RepID=A0A9P8Y8V9_9PEZI|nr:ribosome biogenesis protein [Microdochium trichocladiopsis]KAH7030840.1 ribosome biogenesis protein [Microdochium trichocladiopsis]
MAKRKTHIGDGPQAGKRQKTNHVHDTPTSEEVYNSRQLRQLLAFEQDMQTARHGIQSFKNILDRIIAGGETVRPDDLQMVTEYLVSTKPREVEDEIPIYLPDLMEAWSMAAQVNNESVMSAVPAVLALLLKVISNNNGLVAHGLGIGRTLLQKRQQELIAKNLAADKGKDFIISPTLRLLREAVCIDSGTLAAPIFRARNNTFKALARNIGLRYLGDGVESSKRPSIRTNAIRFLLSSIKYIHVEAKKDLLSQKDVVAALMRHLREDPPALIYEILDTLRASVILDKKLSKDAKVRLLNAQSLIRISSLYGYSHAASDEDPDRPTVEETAHRFLVAACTDASGGVVRSQHGYYPDGIDPDALPPLADFDQFVDQGLDTIPWMSSFENDIPVRNSLLAEFIQTLRPWSSTKQSELLVSILKNVPELVAHYFLHKKAFSFEPKLSATWIGYAALLYNVMELSVPNFFGRQKGFARTPPPIHVLLGNVIPAPLTLKVITRCLANKSNLISFYAVRILVLVLQRLSKIIEMFAEASATAGPLWKQASRRLIDDVQQRIPDVKDVIALYRGLGAGDLLQKEAASRLILLYYENIPQLALKAKFDVSPILSAAIDRVEGRADEGGDAALALMELEHLCTIAKYSPGMRWFGKAAGKELSPFATLLKLYVESTTELADARLQDVLDFVANENQLVESSKMSRGLQPLVLALKEAEGVDASIWSYLDNCFERCARSPIKYLEKIEEQLERAGIPSEDTAASPIMITIGEQLPFFITSSPDKKLIKALVELLSAYLGHSAAVGVSAVFLTSTRNIWAAALGDEKLARKLTVPTKTASVQSPEPSTKASPGQTDVLSRNIPNVDHWSDDLVEILSVPIPTIKDNALLKWSTKAPEELVEEGHAVSVIWLLASEHISIRKEALVTLAKMAAKIRESAYEENEQMWLLLMELIESTRGDPVDAGTVPNTILSFAARAIDVLKNPLHALYEKVNLFLTSGPTWALDRIPLLSTIVTDGPSEDGTFYTEVSWLLSYLVDSLRSEADLALFHHRKVFERVFALACNPYMGNNLRTQVLRLIYRATTIKGGSDTLITRFGAVSWLRTQRAASAADVGDAELYQAVIRRLWETCDQDRIRGWSAGGVEILAMGAEDNDGAVVDGEDDAVMGEAPESGSAVEVKETEKAKKKNKDKEKSRKDKKDKKKKKKKTVAEDGGEAEDSSES